MTEKELNDKMFQDVETCKCGCHNGAYIMRDDNGYWYVCNDCDLPLLNSYHSNEILHCSRHIDEECDD